MIFMAPILTRVIRDSKVSGSNFPGLATSTCVNRRKKQTSCSSNSLRVSRSAKARRSPSRSADVSTTTYECAARALSEYSGDDPSHAAALQQLFVEAIINQLLH